MNATRVLLLDDHAAIREPLARLLELEPDMVVVAQAGSVAEARPVLGGVDVGVFDFQLPDGLGTELIAPFLELNPTGSVLVLTASADDVQLAEAIEAGAAGVLQKSAGIDEILVSVRRAARGEAVMSPPQLSELFRRATAERGKTEEARRALETLSPRERDVLDALTDGLSDKEIASRLGIRDHTVRVHVTNVLGKLGVTSRLQAALFAVRSGATRT